MNSQELEDISLRLQIARERESLGSVIGLGEAKLIVDDILARYRDRLPPERSERLVEYSGRLLSEIGDLLLDQNQPTADETEDDSDGIFTVSIPAES